jgi:cell filamentation protein
MASRYDAGGPQAEFEPGSGGRVLRNLLGIRHVRAMQRAESEALVAAQDALLDHYSFVHRFTAADIRFIHRTWLGGIYPWAGEYRTVNISKGGCMFAAAGQVPRLMEVFQQAELADETPCGGMDLPRLALALARTHAELVLIHPFREGNGRCARVLAYLMAVQAGLPSLDFSPLAGRGRPAYFAAIQSAMNREYAPLEALFAKVIRKTWSSYGGAD